MLKVTDVLELKKRTKPQECNYTRMRGCYVNNDKDKVTELNERFLSLPEEEYYKYLEIASQTLSKKVEDNMLSISLQAGEEDGTIKYLLKRAIASGLQDDETMEQLYDIIISTFNYVGNYLILFYYEAYDVPRVATGGRCIILLDALDEVDKERRQELHSHVIHYFKNQNPNNKVCITSRARGFLQKRILKCLK